MIFNLVLQASQQSLRKLIHNNHEFAVESSEEIVELSHGQHPSAMILGCSDSRVPPELLLKAELGDLFVHRNVANLYNEDDASLNSALFYSTNVLNVTKVAVIGHSKCGGIKHALELNTGQHLESEVMTDLNSHISSVKCLIANTTDHSINDNRVNHLSKKSVLASVERIRKSSVLAKHTQVYGYFYDIENGSISRIA